MLLLVPLSRVQTTSDPNTHLQWREDQLLLMGPLARCFPETPKDVYYDLIHQ